ncbi:hypothetical protein [Streptomyces sp. MUSC 125]|uniref:hypothetical protein n=1 Tax=Streptomyces sp. MUSC 125 TaxID=1428624 RepID=UPI00131D7FC1|nr:hypothetical protein [Streptomyces sp. MUSC 125]
MFAAFETRVLNVREYLAMGRERSELIPRVPGIYIWTLDFTDIGKTALEREPEDVFSIVQKRISVPRGEPLEVGMVGRYRNVLIQDTPPELTRASAVRVEEMIKARNLHLEWPFLCATLFQRPLYVGKAVNLAQRLKAHMKSDSHLSGELERLGLTVNDCAVLLLPVTSPDNIADLVAAEEERARALRAAGAAEATPRNILSGGEYDGTVEDDGWGDDLDDGSDDVLFSESELDAGAPLELRQVDQLVRFAESLTIRAAHPLLNMKMD